MNRNLILAVALLLSVAAIGWTYIYAYRIGDAAGYARRNNEIVTAERDQLLKSSAAMAQAFDQTNKLLLEIHDDAPDNKSIVSPSIASTLDGMHKRQSKNGRINTAPAN